VEGGCRKTINWETQDYLYLPVILVNISSVGDVDELKNNFNNVCNNQNIVIENGNTEIQIELCKPCKNPEYVIELFVSLFFICRHYEVDNDDFDCSKSCTYTLKPWKCIKFK
jgi:hypothetical protein